jgi:hypothetical protein
VKLERTTTGLIIHQPSTEIKRAVLRYFSLTNPVREYFIYSGNDRSKKPLFGKEHDVIYISSGFLNIEDEDIKRLPKPSVINYQTPKKVEITMNREPRSPLQEDCIKQMLNTESSKITIELKPGVELIPAPAYGDVRVKYTPLNCWNDDSNARCATA